MALRDEILEQPAAATRLLESAPQAFAAIASIVARRRPSFVVIAARGSSDNAALYGQYLFAVRNRLPVALATPSAITLFGARPDMSKALVVGISQSGRSPDIVAVIDEARRQGAPTVAITNDTQSPLADAAEHAIDLRAGPELATAATKTYTTQLLAAALLSFALDDPTPQERDEITRVPELIAAVLAAESQAQEIAAALPTLARAVVLGRGYDYATAREWALKLQELAQVLAVPFSTADFEHGPIALADPGLAVLAVAPAGAELDAQQEILGRLRDRHGSDIVIISDSEVARSFGRGMAIPSDVPRWLTPLVSIIPGQFFAYHLTIARGLDPNQPRTIQKVTETR